MPSLWLLTGDTQEHPYTEIYVEHNAKTTQHMCDQVVCAVHLPSLRGTHLCRQYCMLVVCNKYTLWIYRTGIV